MEMDGNGWKWMEMAGNGINPRKIMELLRFEATRIALEPEGTSPWVNMKQTGDRTPFFSIGKMDERFEIFELSGVYTGF